MNVRERLIARLQETIDSGVSVSLVGERGSGRTSVVRRFAAETAEQGWNVLRVRGLPAFREVPLVALSLGGIDAAQTAKVAAMPRVVEELVERLSSPRSVVIVDDWEHLDEVSRGAIDFIRLERNIPLVAADLCGQSLQRPAMALSSSTVARLVEIRIPPLTYDELNQVMRQVLGEPVDSGTLSRIFAKSGGLVGIAVAIVECARREGNLELRDGLWRATRHLWTASLNAQFESLLSPLDHNQRELLELLATTEADHGEAVRRIGRTTAFESLEDQGLVKLYPTDDRISVSMMPPVLADYFRHRSSIARRVRLAGASVEDKGRATLPSAAHLPSRAVEHTSHIVRLVRERAQAQTTDVRAKWERKRTLAAFVDYVDALIHSPAGAHEIDAAFASARDISGDAQSELRRNALFAEHLAFGRKDPEAAILHLRSVASRFGPSGLLLLGLAAELAAETTVVPEPDAVPDPNGERLPDGVRAALHRARALIYLARGELNKAYQHIHALEEIAAGQIDYRAVSIKGMFLVMSGDLASADHFATAGMLDARSRLDGLGMRTFGVIGALTSLVQGQYDRLDELLNSVLPLGEPSSSLPFAHLSLTILSSVAAARRGGREAAVLRMMDAEALSVDDGPMPGACTGLARAYVVAAEGGPSEGAALAIRAGDALWERNARLAAAYVYLTAMEFVPSRSTLSRLRARIEAVDIGVVPEELRYVEALVSEEPDAVLRAAEAFEDRGRIGLAHTAYREAVRLASASDDGEIASAAQERLSSLAAGSPSVPLGTVGADSRLALLSAREREIAERAAEGHSNKRIATDLVLSVRTVESHLRRAMQKAGATRRTDFRQFFGSPHSRV